MQNVPLAISCDFGDGQGKVYKVYEGGRFEPVMIDDGSEAFVNAVYRDPATGEITIGRHALAIGAADPENLAINYKRDIANPAKNYWGNTATAFDVAVACLGETRKKIEAEIGRSCPPVAMSTPVMWSDEQKKAMKAAFERAGFKLFAEKDGSGPLINEPTAAMLASVEGKAQSIASTTFLVIDIGSSTTDITLGRFECEQLNVLSHDGDTKLGGQDMRTALRDLLLKKAGVRPELFEKIPIEIRFGFLMSVENGLKALGSAAKFKFAVPTGDGAKIKPVEITRAEFNKHVIDPFADGVIAAVKRCFKGQTLTYEQVTHIQLVGGPSANPHIQERLAKELGRSPSCDVNPIMAIAKGVAYHAMNLVVRDGGSKPMLCITGGGFKDIVPISVGIAIVTKDQKTPFCKVLFPKGTPANSDAKEYFGLHEPDQTEVDIRVLQGEDGQLESDCYCIGRSTLCDLPLEQERTARLEVKAFFDSAGIARLYVTDVISKKQIKVDAKVDPAASNKVA